MRVLSWDIGKKNMAYCLLEFHEQPATTANDPSPPRVLQWGTIDITTTGKTTRDYTQNLIDFIKQHMDWIQQTELCLLENQSKYAPTLQCLAAALHAALYSLVPTMRFANVSASLKFKTFLQADITEADTAKSTYTKHKKLGQQLVVTLLGQWNDVGALELFAQINQNKDMADALTNAAAFIYSMQRTTRKRKRAQGDQALFVPEFVPGSID